MVLQHFLSCGYLEIQHQEIFVRNLFYNSTIMFPNISSILDNFYIVYPITKYSMTLISKLIYIYAPTKRRHVLNSYGLSLGPAVSARSLYNTVQYSTVQNSIYFRFHIYVHLFFWVASLQFLLVTLYCI